ncbi:AsnC family protein [Actinokineospora sp. 24-640]
MVGTDAVDARLLGVVAELGRAAVHEVAARLGMDPREVAARLVALSAAGLPLLVGVECDPNGLRAALARMAPQPGYGYPPAQPQYPSSGPVPSGPYQVGQPSGPHQPPAPHQVQPHQGQSYQGQSHQAQSHQGQPSGAPTRQPSGPHQVQQNPRPMYQPPHQPQGGPHQAGPPPYPGPPSQPFPAADLGEAINTWGPPQTSSWARGDQPPGAVDRTQPAARPRREGRSGESLEAEGLEGERLAIKLIEVVDPADYLFTAAGYTLQPGERSVVVHTELTNRGRVTFASLPDLYLVLVAADGQEITKAPVSLSSRPAHRIGVASGETAGGHTVYVVPEDTVVTSVRWSPRPDEESRTLTWVVEN